MKKKIILLLVVGILFVSCKGDDMICCGPPYITNCNKNAVIDEVVYQQILIDNYVINNLVLNGGCLEITVSASGCDPNNWDMNFIASEVVVETNPIEYKTKVELINNETCLAVFQKTVSFDLTPLQISGANQIQLNIDDWNTPVIYQY